MTRRCFVHPHILAAIVWPIAIISAVLVLPARVYAEKVRPSQVLFSAPANANVASTSTLFFPAVIYPAGGLTDSLAVADVNGDANPDLLVADYNGGVDVLLGNADGTFRPAVFYDAGACCVNAVAVADVNGDGRPDVALSLWTANEIAVLRGNGDGSFQLPLTYDSSGTGGGSCPNSIALADLNADNRPDLVVANWCGTTYLSKTLDVLLNQGDGTFGAATSYASGGQIAESVAVVDVNLDGRPDIVVGNWFDSFQDTTGGAVGVLLNNGDGTFQATSAYGSGGYGASWVAVGDVNGDGIPDLATANCEASPGSICSSIGMGRGVMGILLGNGDGTFRPAAAYDLGGAGAGMVAMADVNGDRRPDLLFASCPSPILCTGNVAVVLGNGDGTFQAAVNYASGGNAAAFAAVADVNHDNWPDLFVSTCGGLGCGEGEVGVLLHTRTDTTPPVVKISANPTILWPPNGKLVSVKISGAISDPDSGIKPSSAEYAVEDEYRLIEPYGKVALDSAGNYSFTILLRASREGGDRDGRQYTIRVSAWDNAGNRGVKWARTVVPHED